MKIQIRETDGSVMYYLLVNFYRVALIYMIDTEGTHYDFRNLPGFKNYARDYNTTKVI